MSTVFLLEATSTVLIGLCDNPASLDTTDSDLTDSDTIETQLILILLWSYMGAEFKKLREGLDLIIQCVFTLTLDGSNRILGYWRLGSIFTQ
jgi:hypothetical protein